MTLESEINIQLEKTDELLGKVSTARPTVPEFPNYAHLGDLERFNGMLAEILETFGGCE